ncbi:PRTase-like protein [Aspergillus indologenus CBS 114.80]|uniref:uracil phosphoribosyltransferase n=1 Tax=Aspergillus indologenus CBS 114.80 TaxID=1450541 RepID=A0A2V5IJC8_9EURO|nr:PRTase-like protein [Aspergillus indologenus CBS 114.80]
MSAPTAGTTPALPTTTPMDHVTVLEQDRSLLSLMTIIRDVNTDDRAFVSAVEKVVHRLISSALNHVPAEEHTVTTPLNTTYQGLRFTKGVCGVSILRAGASMEQVLRDTWTGRLSFGKLLIQRDEETSIAKSYYSKLPAGICNDVVLLLEPMLATGGSVIKAVETLTEHGVPEESIVLVNVVSSKKGLDVITGRFPALKIVSAAVDADLTAQNYISPGLGDFGDRYYGTC